MYKNVFVFLAAAAAMMLAVNGVAQNVDYHAVVTDSNDPVVPGTVVSFEVEVGNDGPGVSPEAVNCDITLPMGVPMGWTDYLALDAAARDTVDDTFLATSGFSWDPLIWQDGVSGLYMGDSFNNGCEGLLVQAQDLAVAAGSSGKFYFDATLPAVGGTAGVAYKPAGGDMVVLNYGRAGCNSVLYDNCGDGNPANGFPCMGTPLTVHQAVPAPVTYVGDGCEPEDFSSFPAGNVALIDRGNCYFYVKGQYATGSGASAILIGNTAALGSVTPTADSVMSMGCTDPVCNSLSISPSAFISYNSNTELQAALGNGEVMAYLGVRDASPEDRITAGYLWSNGGTDTDVDNDKDYETTTIQTGLLFADAFESGNTSAWSEVVPPQAAKVREPAEVQIYLTPSPRQPSANF